MRKGKRLLSILLAVAMVITGVNIGTLAPVKAAEGDNEYNLVLERFESGANNDANKNGKLVFITTSENNDTGNMNKGAGVNGTTYGGGPSVCGNNRAAGIQFKLPDNVKAEEVDSAILTINVANVDGCNLNSGWTKAALYETANPTSWTLDGSDANAGNLKDIPSINGYSKDATIWSTENIASNNLGAKTFDVTKAIKNAINTEGLSSIVLRLQTVRGGFKVSGLKTTEDTELQANAPTLKVLTSKKSTVTVNYLDKQNNELKEAKTIELVKVGSPYTYEIADDEKRITTESGTYIYDETSNAAIAEVKEDAAQNVINLTYDKAEPSSVIAPSTIYAIEGNEPILPRQLTANTNIAGVTLPVNVTWDVADKKWAVGDNKVTGTAEGLEGAAANVTATVHIYECDEAVADFATGSENSGKFQQLAKEYGGELITEFDITSLNTDDSCYSYLSSTDTNIDNAFSKSGPMLQYDKTNRWFISRTGNGTGGADNYPTASDNVEKMMYESGKTYRARMVIDTKADNGNYHIYVTDETGRTVEITKPEGNKYRTYNDGTIRRFFVARKNLTVTNHKISWQSGYATVQIDYRSPTGEAWEDFKATTKELPSSSKTIDTAIFTPKSVDGKTYLFDAENSGWDTNNDGAADFAATDSTTIPAAGDTVHYIAKYKESALLGTDEVVEVETLVGKAPILPLTLEAKYDGVEGTIPTEVTWNLEDADLDTETADNAPLEITGTFPGGKTVTAKVHVKHAYLLAKYTFDGDNPAADSTGRHADAVLTNVDEVDGVDAGSKGVKLKGGKNGSSNVKLPDDLLQLTEADGKKTTQDDFTVSMFINRESNGNSFAMTLHATQVGKSDPQGHLGFINKDSLVDMEYRIGGTTVANLQAKNEEGGNILTPIGQWSHVAIVTNGSKDTAKLYLDGVLVGTVTGICKPSQLTAQNNYLGRASWPDDDYKATFDDFEVYNGILTEAEIQKIANDRLCSAPVQDIYDNLELSLQSEEAFDKTKITEALNLPTVMETSDGKTVQGLKITWESDNAAIRSDGTVVRPSKGKGNAANITLKAKIQYGSSAMTKTFSGLTVLELDKVSFVEYDEAFANADNRYKSAKKENIYTADSLAAMKTKLDELAQVKETEGTPDENADEVDAATAELLEVENLLVLKTFQQMDEALAAWYPLDDATDKAKDVSGNGLNGEAAATVTFDRENGATFNGEKALENSIKLPKEALDALKVTDYMTFSFWTNFSENRNLFGIGSNIGGSDKNNGSASKHFYINSTLNAYVTANGWATNAHKGFANVPVSKNEWHHITAVVSGNQLKLYVDKQKVLQGGRDAVDTDILLTEAWNHNEGANRYFYIGNCAYGHNGDADFKGSIKDFRIYNAALAQEQIEGAYSYIDTLPMKYAKDDIMKALGAREEADGTVVLNVTNLNTTDKTLTLPLTSYGDAKVAWTSSDDNVINADTGAAAVPDSKNEPAKTADLTATITIGEGDSQQTAQIIFKCKVYYKNDTDTSALETAIQTLTDKKLKQQDYTQASWTALQTALTNAYAQVDNPDDAQTVATVKSALESAEGNLVNISELRDKIASLTSEMEDLDKDNYTTASLEALQDKLDAANEVLETADATKDAVSAAVGSLPQTAVSVLKECGDKEPLEKAIADADALAKYQEAYTETTWNELTTALQTAEAELAKKLEDYAPAADELKSVMAALEVKEEHKLEGTAKEELDEKLAEAKEEALESKNYTPQTWGEYKAALNALEEVLNRANATKDEAEDAAQALEEARAALQPIATQIPDEPEIEEFTTAYGAAVSAAAGMKPEIYSEESWSRYQKALAAMKKISDRLAEENNNVTKAEIETAIAELNAAKEALVIIVDKTALNKAISDCGSLKAADYTPESWNAFQTALNAAKTVAAKADATQQEVNNALTALNAKKTALQKAQSQVITVKVKKIALSADSKNIAAGKKVTVKAAITPADAANKAVTWKSSNTKWATVNGKGVVTTKKAGAGKTVTITATANDGSNIKGTIKIKIMKNAVTKITLKAKAKKVKVGKKVTIKATVKANGKKVNKKLTWKSSNTKWATVNGKGVVTAKKAGAGKTVTITATSTDGTKKSAKVKIKIVK